jgi:hypothetical protein
MRGVQAYTIIREYFILHKVTIRKNGLPVLTYTANVWHTFDIDKDLVTRKFLAQ